jgi:hypothetical protein
MTNYNKHEQAETRRLGGKTHKNSGRGQVKGDASWRDFIVDYKFSNRSVTVNQEMWAKIVTDAMKTDRSKSPLLVLVIGEGSHKIRLGVLELSVLEELTSENQDGIIVQTKEE